MTRWNCTHCGQVHHEIADWEACAKRERSAKRLALAIVVSLAVIILAVMIAWNVYVYGDWTCVFAECRKVITK